MGIYLDKFKKFFSAFIAWFHSITSFVSRFLPLKRKRRTGKKLAAALKSHEKLLARLGLTTEESHVIEILFLYFEGNKIDPLFAYDDLPYMKTGLRNVLIKLQEKGILLKKSYEVFPFGPIKYNKLRFDENFLKQYRISSEELCMELLDAYPNEAIIQGQAVPLKNFAKRFKNEEEFFFAYGKSIGWSTHKHKEILELIQWSKDNDHFGLNMNISDFVISKMWESILDHKIGSKVCPNR